MKLKARVLSLLTLTGIMLTLTIKYVSAAGYEYPVGGTVEFAEKIILVTPIVSIGIVAVVVLGIIAKVLASRSEEA